MSVSLNENVMGKLLIYIKFGPSGRGKAGVKLKNNFECKMSLKKAKLMYFVLLKD